MKKTFKKHPTVNSINRTPQTPLVPVTKRELGKQTVQGTNFQERPVQENVPTTSIGTDGQEWQFAANCFGLMKDRSHEQRMKDDAELLRLCNFYGSQETLPTLADDDDEIPFDVFAEQGMRMSYKPLTLKEPTVSSLDLTQRLRINSSAKIVVGRSSGRSKEQENIPSAEVLEKEQQMEMAFQGDLPCSNSSQKLQKRRASLTQKAAKMEKVEEKKEEEEDFWSNVEF